MINLKYIVAAVCVVASCAAYANGGESGNEKLTKDGRPISTDVRECYLRIEGKDFIKQMNERKDILTFFNDLHAIYPPIYLRVMDQLKDTVICETDKPINEVWSDPGAQKRLARWEAGGEGNRDLLLIDTKAFFLSPQMTDAKRAATILREMLHSEFSYKPFEDVEAQKQKIEWQKHNLIFELHKDFVAGTLPAHAEKYVHMFSDYGLIQSSTLYYGDTALACYRSAEDCQKTFEMQALVVRSGDLDQNVRTLLRWSVGLPVGSTNYLFRRLEKAPADDSDQGGLFVAQVIGAQTKQFKTVAEFAELHDGLAASALMSSEVLAEYTTSTIQCAAEIFIQGNCLFTKTINGIGNPAEGHAIMDYLRSIQAPIQTAKMDLVWYDDTQKKSALLNFLSVEHLGLDGGSQWNVANWLMKSDDFKNLATFRAFVDQYPDFFNNAMGGFMYDEVPFTSNDDILKIAYLVEKGLVTENLKGTLKKTLEQRRDTRSLARRL